MKQKIVKDIEAAALIKRKKKDDAEDEEEPKASKKAKKAQKKAKKAPKEAKKASAKANASDDVHEWVGCDTCGKWRKLALGMDPEDLPEMWHCNMNSWATDFATCDAPEEEGADA